MPSFTHISDAYISSRKLAGFESLTQLLKSPKTKVLVDKGTVVAEVAYRDSNNLITLTSGPSGRNNLRRSKYGNDSMFDRYDTLGLSHGN